MNLVYDYDVAVSIPPKLVLGVYQDQTSLCCYPLACCKEGMGYGRACIPVCLRHAPTGNDVFSAVQQRAKGSAGNAHMSSRSDDI